MNAGYPVNAFHCINNPDIFNGVVTVSKVYVMIFKRIKLSVWEKANLFLSMF